MPIKYKNGDIKYENGDIYLNDKKVKKNININIDINTLKKIIVSSKTEIL